ncbi:hypothetical protein B598_0280 [Chlamydia psittaci GR9]|uniref:hypothetical protein n=1 Tax=Chlamydia psittaci TaxID=83554 RepID=UPI00027E17B7|nr:hypothetical protein [Chlamydia psittaci]AFS20370.1 hypothetical protein B598_0280 [Chlamydia psittaci GR9]AFS23937.1 hypothetical protein B601_0280 [Chlamydia psittaci WS/RT/E30]
MNPINPYGSSIPGPSQGPAEGGGKSDPLRGVGGKFTRRGAIRGRKGVRGYQGYLESKVSKHGSEKAHKAASRVEQISTRIKASGAKASDAISCAAYKAGKMLTQTAKQVKSKIQDKISGKKGPVSGKKESQGAPQQSQMKVLAKEAVAKVGKMSAGVKRSLDASKLGASKSPSKQPKTEGSSAKGRSGFSPDLGAIANRDRVKLPRANVQFQQEGERKSQRLANQKTKGILKQPGAPKTGKKGVRWADQEGKSLEQ